MNTLSLLDIHSGSKKLLLLLSLLLEASLVIHRHLLLLLLWLGPPLILFNNAKIQSLLYIWLFIYLIIYLLTWYSSPLFMFTLFPLGLKTTVAGFEPTPPEEKWFQVTRLRPLGHTVFVFILSLLFMYYNIKHRTPLSVHLNMSFESSLEVFNWLQVCFHLFSLLNSYYLLIFPFVFLLSIQFKLLFSFYLFIYLFIYLFSSSPSLKVSFNMFFIYCIDVMLP